MEKIQMMYQLQIKQLVTYPRCRIYRSFIQNLMKDENLHTNGSSRLFYYTVLCSYANFRTSYQRVNKFSYLITPGEWICTCLLYTSKFHFIIVLIRNRISCRTCCVFTNRLIYCYSKS